MSHYNILQHITTHYNTLQHTATHSNALQHTATNCNNWSGLHNVMINSLLHAIGCVRVWSWVSVCVCVCACVWVCMCVCVYKRGKEREREREDICTYTCTHFEEDTLGVFWLGWVKSLETLGNGCSSTKSLLSSWNVERVVELGCKIYPNSQFLLNTISLTERSNRQPGSTA